MNPADLEPYECCRHCECPPDAPGHEEPCSYGCNDWQVA